MKLATRGLDLPHTPLMGQALAGCCTKPLVEFGAQALADCRAGVPSRALQEVALDIIISTGLVSNMTTHETEYYYNSSIAHAVYNGSTVVPACVRGHRHGEVVAFGVLVLLTYDGQLEERARLMAFNKSIGLPVTMAGAGLSLADLPALADKASTVTEWTCTPYPMNKEKLIQAIVDLSLIHICTPQGPAIYTSKRAPPLPRAGRPKAASAGDLVVLAHHVHIFDAAKGVQGIGDGAVHLFRPLQGAARQLVDEFHALLGGVLHPQKGFALEVAEHQRLDLALARAARADDQHLSLIHISGVTMGIGKRRQKPPFRKGEPL